MNQRTIYNINFKMIDWGGKLKKIINYIFHHYSYTCLKRNKELMQIKRGHEGAYILALGPSLKQVNINRITGDTMVVNRFYKMGSLFPDFVPTYYMMLDYRFGEKEHEKDFRAALDMYLSKGTIFFLNYKLYNSDVLKDYSSKNIYFISCFGGDIHANQHYRLDRILPAFQNVVGNAIMTLSLLGYKKISLLGCDFNSFASTEKTHCYKDESKERTLRMAWELYAYSIVAHQYDDLQQYAKNNGIEIINTTKGSLIDSFPFVIDEKLYF